MSVLKIEGQIFSQNILECPSVQVSVLKIEGQIFFSEYFRVSKCPSVRSQNRGSDLDFFSQNILQYPSDRVSFSKYRVRFRFFSHNILECPSVQVSILKIVGQIFS